MSEASNAMDAAQSSANGTTGPGSTEPSDAKQFEPGYGKGGVPWYLLLYYLSFLTFFTWYVLEYQLPDFLDQGPGQTAEKE